MTKLVQYIGDADEKTISSAELAAHGITSPDLVFAKGEGDDYFESVPDIVAMFLLSQGDFIAYDGSTILDIFENNASPEAEPEVLSVQIEGEDPMSGSVVLPAGGSGAQSALRKLGYDVGEAMPGNDDVRLQAVRTTLFSGDGREVLVANHEGVLTAVTLPVGTVLASTDEGMVALTYAELETLIETGGEGLSLGGLSDTDVTSQVDGYVLTYVEATNSYALRPIPTLPVHVTLSGGRIGVVSPEVNDDGYVDISANNTNLVFEIDATVTPLALMMPAPEFGSLIILKFMSDAPVNVAVHIDGDPDPAFSFTTTPNEYTFAFPVQEDDGTGNMVPTWNVSGIAGGSGGGSSLLPANPIVESPTVTLTAAMASTLNMSAVGGSLHVIIPPDLDAPDGTRWHFTNISSDPFGLHADEMSVSLFSIDGYRGIPQYGEAILWKQSPNQYLLFGDLVVIGPPVIEPPVEMDYYSLLEDLQVPFVWPLGGDTFEGYMDEIGFATGVFDGTYVDAAGTASTAMVFEQPGPYAWLPSVEITADSDRGRATGIDMNTWTAFTVAGWWRPGATVSDASDPIFQFRANSPTDANEIRFTVTANNGGSPSFSGFSVLIEEWDVGSDPAVDPADQTWGFNAFDALPQTAEEWLFWAVSFDVNGNDTVIQVWLNGVLQNGNTGGTPLQTTNLGSDCSVDVAIATSGVPDRFFGVILTPGTLSDATILSMYESAAVMPEGWEPPPEPMMFFRMSADSFERADAPTLGAPDDGIPVLYEYEGDGTWEVSDNSAVFTGGSAGRHTVFCDTAGFQKLVFVMGEGDVGTTSTIEVVVSDVYDDATLSGTYTIFNEAGEFWTDFDNGEPPVLMHTLAGFPGFVVGETVTLEWIFDGPYVAGYRISVGEIFSVELGTDEGVNFGGADYIGFSVNFVTGQLPKRVDFWEASQYAASLSVPKAFAGTSVHEIQGGMWTGPGGETTTYNGSWEWTDMGQYTGQVGSGYTSHYRAIEVTEGDLKYTRIHADVATPNQFVAACFRPEFERRNSDPISELARNGGLVLRGSASSFLALRFGNDAGTGSMTLHAVTDNGATETLLHTFGSPILDALNIIPPVAGWSVIRAFIGADDIFWLQVNGVTESIDLSAETLPTGTDLGVLYRQTTDGAVPPEDMGIGWYILFAHALV